MRVGGSGATAPQECVSCSILPFRGELAGMCGEVAQEELDEERGYEGLNGLRGCERDFLLVERL